MGFKAKNLIIFLGILLLVVLFYFFFLKGDSAEEPLLTSSSSTDVVNATGGQPPPGQDFLTLLLSVKNINLDDSVFSDPAFASLNDSTILLIPDGNEGRRNPFAPLGSDI